MSNKVDYNSLTMQIDLKTEAGRYAARAYALWLLAKGDEQEYARIMKLVKKEG